MKTTLKQAAIISGCVLVFGAISCKKKDAITPPVAVTSCFLDTYNGTYTGTGMVGGTYYNGPLTLTKLSCTSAKIIKAGSIIENITSLTASNGGGYTGVNANSESATIKVTNDTLLDITIGTTMTFSGHK